MKMQRVLSGLALACGLVGSVQADSLLASGPVYGGPTQNHVACTIFNAGTTPITFVARVISSQSLASVPLTFNNCTTLEPNRICTFQTAASNQAYSCKAFIIQATTDVRGTMVALTPANTVLSEAALR